MYVTKEIYNMRNFNVSNERCTYTGRKNYVTAIIFILSSNHIFLLF